jgi:3-oxoadipate enol-lactonase
MQFASVNGGVKHYLDQGPRNAPCLVFINSLGTDFRIWNDLAQPLTQHYRVIRHDKRGHGLSQLPTGPASIADFATDLSTLLDRLEVKQATIVGLSIGGLIAQELLRLRPDLVRSLVLADTAHRIGTEDSWNARTGLVEAKGIEAIADGVIALWFSKDYHRTSRDALTGWRTMLTRTPVEGYLVACRAIRDADLTEAARRIAVPTLCVVGDEDGSTPVALVRELASMIPAAKFEVISGAGHLPCIERPDALRALIESHAAEVWNDCV